MFDSNKEQSIIIDLIIKKLANKLNLPQREEFDTQCKVLLKTRQKIDDLETKISLLEKNINK